jgi:DAK2 domain fusion protein YloV
LNRYRLSAQDLYQMILSGHHSLLANKEAVNALNIFPVPDGDTGTNMSLTMTSGVNEVNKHVDAPLGRIAESLATGLLMGARGNSGVILSQLFRGFAKAVSNSTDMDAKQFANALQNGVDTAYRAVAKPVEGTILTVAKDAAKAAQKAIRKTADLVELMTITLEEAERSLKRTPELLPVLKQAGVVDSGGQGLVFIYKGFLAALQGETVANEIRPKEPVEKAAMFVAGAHIEHEGEYGYCTEFMISVSPDQCKRLGNEESLERSVREQMAKHGDSLLVVAMNDLVKVHIHSEHPGRVLETALEYGSLTKIKIDNMTDQHHTLVENYGAGDDTHRSVTTKTGEQPDIQNQVDSPEAAERKRYAIVAVIASKGIQQLLKSIGVDGFVEGGQTMNPSTEDIMDAVKSTNADDVFILPNNSNIILAAEQCKNLLGDRVHIIPTKSIPQAIAAVVAFDPNKTAEVNQENMKHACERVNSGQITQAVRDSRYQDKEIHAGDYLGIMEGKVVEVSTDLQSTWLKLLQQMIDENSEIVTVLYGDTIDQETAEHFVQLASDQFGHVDFELHQGGQPLYPFLVGVE